MITSVSSFLRYFDAVNRRAMRDVAALVDSVRTDLDEHDHLTKHYGVEPSERVDVLRSDVESLLAEVDRLRKAVAVLKPALVHDPDTSACRLREARQAELSLCQQRPPEGDWPCRGCAAVEEAGVALPTPEGVSS